MAAEDNRSGWRGMIAYAPAAGAGPEKRTGGIAPVLCCTGSRCLGVRYSIRRRHQPRRFCWASSPAASESTGCPAGVTSITCTGAETTVASAAA